ncbi:hypothetical protein IT407_00865 [Candidatus Uhrbacteria bacterium]|nr:hypothetical protein [Candidatus Uhrbacteria bacterium]
MKLSSRLLSVIAIAALLGAGCGPTAAPTAGTGSSGGLFGGGSSASACNNPYYPFTPNTSIVYGMTGVDSDFTMATLPPTAGGDHKLEYTFIVRGTTNKISQEFTCQNGSIRAKGHLDFASAFGQGISFETISTTGEFLPADLSTGKKWTSEYKVKIMVSNEQLKALLDGKEQTMKITSEVLGEESVTVPAGTYTAKKIKQVIETSNPALPTTIKIEQTIWLVRDIGLVKSEVISQGGTPSKMEAKVVNR